MSTPTLSVIIPALNEAASLPELLDRTARTCSERGIRYEILIVDDGSNDETAQVLRSLATRYPGLQVVRFRRNYGKAAALSEGFGRATPASSRSASAIIRSQSARMATSVRGS